MKGNAADGAAEIFGLIWIMAIAPGKGKGVKKEKEAIIGAQAAQKMPAIDKSLRASLR